MSSCSYISDSLANEILNRFMILHMGEAFPLSTGVDYPSWAVGWNNCLGVIVPYDGSDINEDFNSVSLTTIYPIIQGLEERRYLAILTSAENAKAHFASICEDFIRPGENGISRKTLLSEPLDWWASWRDLLGNSSSERAVYSVMGEMVVLLHLKKQGYDVKWEGPKSSSHDITSTKIDFEVKSTTDRYDYKIHIAGEHQLKVAEGKKLKLYFCRFEESFGGISLENLIESLIGEGLDKNEILSDLRMLGIKQGSHLMKMRYDIKEMVSFDVNSSFPMITDASFIGGVKPRGTSNISYMVDLLAEDKEFHTIPKIL